MTNEQRLCNLLPTVQIYYFDSMASTNDWLKEHADREKHGTLVSTNMQTNGRGRLNRTWLSARNKNIAMSILLKKCLADEKNSQIPMMVAVAICDVLQHYCDARIKWPNDILINGKKCGGILIERVFKGEGSFMIIGLGLNVNNDHLTSSIALIATSIFLETGISIDIIKLIAQIYQSIFSYWNQLNCTDHFEPIWQKYCAWSWVIGKDVVLLQGEKEYYGHVQFIDSYGMIHLLSREGKEKKFIQGEISLRLV